MGNGKTHIALLILPENTAVSLRLGSNEQSFNMLCSFNLEFTDIIFHKRTGANERSF